MNCIELWQYTVDGVSFSVYGIDWRKYTKSVLLDGYNIRQCRIRSWPADADFENGPSTYQYHMKAYILFMSNKNGLKSYSLSAQLENQFWTETFQTVVHVKDICIWYSSYCVGWFCDQCQYCG